MEYIGKYKIQKELSSGGFGAVYLAEDPKLHELVAIKLFQIKDDNLTRLATGGTADSGERLQQRFLDEARTLRQLGKNPHIVNVFDFDELDDGRPYYVMPYLPRSLKDELGSDASDISVIADLSCDEKPRRLPVNQTLIYLSQLLLALSDVHKVGLVHRDIKPANLLLNEDNEVQLCDFGIAKLPDVQHSQSGIGMGSRNYMAPEQRQSAKHVDSRSDIYSVGVLAYRMITGTLPEGRFAEPNTFQPGLSDKLNQLILKALQPQKENRFADAGEMLKTLKQAQQNHIAVETDETTTWVGEEAANIELQTKSELKPLETKIIELLQSQGEVRENDKIHLQALADIADLDQQGLADFIRYITEQQSSAIEQKALIQWVNGINKRLHSSLGGVDDTYIASAVTAGASTTGKTQAQLRQLLREKNSDVKDAEEVILDPEQQEASQQGMQADSHTQSQPHSSLSKVAFILVLLLVMAGGGYYGFNYYQAVQLKAQQVAIAQNDEQGAWAQAQQLNTIAGYQLYVKSWPEGQKVLQAITRQAQLTELLRFAQLSQAEKRSEQIKQAQQLLRQLNFQISTNGKLDTRTQKAIKQFEMSQQLIVTGEVDQVLLSNLNRVYNKLETAAWNTAQAENSSKSYQHYIDNFPSSLNLSTAEQAFSVAKELEKIAAAKSKAEIKAKADAQKADDSAWLQAQKKNTISAYQTYLSAQAKGHYRTDANKLLKKLVEEKQQAQIAIAKAQAQAGDRYQLTNKDQLVKDKITKLQWMRCSLGQIWDGKICAGYAVRFQFQDALAQARSYQYIGISDWRVPTIAELRSLVYCSSSKPANFPSNGKKCQGHHQRPTINQQFFPQTKGAEYWSSSPYDSAGWYVNFIYGSAGNQYKDYYGYVRLVRGGQ